jgi:PadR family transcriptional regulator PadR
MNIDKDLVAAMSTPLVLAILAEMPNYGYAIHKRVRDLSDGDLEWTDGMLYPLLHRMARLGYLTASWGTSEEGRRRKYYELTEAGAAELAHQREQWATANRTLGGLWSATAPTTRMAEA